MSKDTASLLGKRIGIKPAETRCMDDHQFSHEDFFGTGTIGTKLCTHRTKMLALGQRWKT